MSTSGFGDAEKLALAQELAQSFKQGSKGPHKGAPKSTQQPHHRAAQGPQAISRGPTASSHAADSAFKHGAPPPSQRRYQEHGKFSRPSLTEDGKPIINMERTSVFGAAAFEFLLRKNENSGDGATKSNAGAAQFSSATHGGPSQVIDISATSRFQSIKPDDISKGSILDRFYNIVNLDQEIKQDHQRKTRSALNVEARPFIPLNAAKKVDQSRTQTTEPLED
ncbi:hypothetical protein CDD81_2856 [Ophiocordyceps australis]|uniref:Uncharacterized protein n=1 Tax=Ophiocordyceps australis TaxID=1399860 RepID=A0A2C5XED0_9HYPO|nr:hypothetical protein CDD81_2856 [Ophiocordyceps australis]